MISQQTLEMQVEKLHAELAACSERFRAFLELSHTAFGCIEFDQPICTNLPAAQQASCMLAGHVVECNREFARIYGATHEDDLLNTRFVSLIFSIEEKFIPRARRFVAAGYRLVNEEIDQEFPDGTQKFLIADVLGEVQNGGLKRIWIAYQDVTLRRLVERAMEGGHEELDDMAKRMDCAFWMMDWKNFKVLYIGSAYETIWKRSVDQLYADPMSWLESVHPEDRQRVQNAFLAHAVDGSYDSTFRIVLPDNSIRVIRDQSFPIFDATGAVHKVVGLAADVTEPEENRIGLDHFFNMAHEMLAVIDADGNFCQANPAFCNYSGYAEADLIGERVLDFIHDDDRELSVQTVNNLNAGIAAVDVENRFLCKDGDFRKLQWNIAPICSTGALYAIVHDFTDHATSEMNNEPVVSPRLAMLTERERQIMRLVVDGQPNKSIARKLGISQRTVEKHRGRVMSKLGVDNVPDLVRLAMSAETNIQS